MSIFNVSPPPAGYLIVSPADPIRPVGGDGQKLRGNWKFGEKNLVSRRERANEFEFRDATNFEHMTREVGPTFQCKTTRTLGRTRHSESRFDLQTDRLTGAVPKVTSTELISDGPGSE